MRDFDIDSDLKQEKFQSLKLVQGDRGNKIKINVYEDGQPVNLAGCSVTAKYKRADGEIINDGVIENIHDNSFDAVMDSSITKVAGTLKMLFTIEKDAVKVSAFLLLADVREGIGESSSSGGSAGGGEVTIDLSNYYKKLETYSRKEIDAQFKDIAKQTITTEERNKLTNLENYDDSSIKNDIQTQKARIDSFTSLKEGSTTGDAELIDGRVGADGTTYENIGSSIRSQFNKISEAFYEGKNTIDFNNITSVGLISSSDGDKKTSENRLACDFYVPLTNINKLYIEVKEGVKYNLAFYNSEKVFTKGVSFNQNSYTYSVIGYEFFRCTFAFNDDRVINDKNKIELINHFNVYHDIYSKKIDELERNTTVQVEESRKSIILDSSLDTNSIKISCSKNTDDANIITVTNRNILPNDLVFFNNNNDTFDTTDNPAITRVRSSSFMIPSLYKFTLSGLKNDIKVVSVRCYNKGKTLIPSGGTIIKVSDSVYRIELANDKNIEYIHLLFAKIDNSVFDKTELATLNLMLEYGEDAHSYVAHEEKTLNADFNNPVYADEFLIGDYSIVYSKHGDIQFTITKNKYIGQIIDEFNNKFLEKDILTKYSNYAKSKYYRNNDFSSLFSYKYYECSDECNELSLDSSSSDLYEKIDLLINSSAPYITKELLGKDSSNTYDMYAYKLNETTNINVEKPKIIIIANQHGYEKGGAITCYYLMKELVNNWQLNEILEFIRFECELIIFPLVNPYGFNQYTSSNAGSETGYYNANGINLNRNYSNGHIPSSVNGDTPFSENETQYVKNIIDSNTDALYFVDLHANGTTRTSDKYKYCNWISLVAEGNEILEDIAKEHIQNISRHNSKKFGLSYNDFGFYSSSKAGGMAKDYGDIQGISSNTFECAHKIPNKSTTEFDAITNKYNISIFVNWLGSIINKFKVLNNLK